MSSVIAKKPGTKVTRKNLVAGVQSDFSFAQIYRVQPIDRIRLMRTGVPARYINVIADSMGITKDTLFRYLNLPRSTVDKKLAASQILPIEQGERLIGMAKLVGQVESMIAESGNPDGFDAAKWVASWLEKPSPALGGEKPSAYLDTISGQEMISDLLAKIQTGAYA
ncbi:antitoxin Xre-like helix-turn-helix domain-containing protein [Polynucleobacter necessarius]|uniref:type II RES/Xre toxin-antitoxin system antitoxin n=1 Tax=Polynucleobacter necessarius TaxID=576610 RepID=UPI000E08F614|nr:antitoxin Xre-like helix-turn-helix domain-containing protein [Polynucleobacter necessarius]